MGTRALQALNGAYDGVYDGDAVYNGAAGGYMYEGTKLLDFYSRNGKEPIDERLFANVEK